MNLGQLVNYGEAIGGGVVGGMVDVKYADKKPLGMPVSACLGLGLALGGMVLGGGLGRHAGEVGAGMLAGSGYRYGANAAAQQAQAAPAAATAGVFGAPAQPRQLSAAPQARRVVQASEVDQNLAMLRRMAA